jgi:hypothetical protein
MQIGIRTMEMINTGHKVEYDKNYKADFFKHFHRSI